MRSLACAAPHSESSKHSRHWAINVAWTQVVALAANLLARFRHLALPAGELRNAAPKLLRFQLLHLPALTRGQRKRWLHLRADWPWTPDRKATDRSVEPGAPEAIVGPRPTHKHEIMIKTTGPR